MLIHYAYIKPRSQFGKQCIFEKTDSIVEENILPSPKLMQDYILRSRCHRDVQKSEQFSLHEMQTITTATKESGMLHLEGGWPREINVKDEEAVLRFRRRVEKDDNWAPRMRKLIDPMEHCILQNNTIDIYENYFDNMVSTSLILPRVVRIANVYADPQPIVRPANHLSWSPGAQDRLAASYSFAEFETKPSGVIPCSYIWDIENPNTPVICLESSLPLMITEFNPRDPSMLISGLTSGQVCNWDIRIGNRPVQMSRRQFSHSRVTLVPSVDVICRRRAKKSGEPGALDSFQNQHGVLLGTENGLVINVNRKFASPVDKLATRFNCYVGPVITIERNPFVPKNFLTVGDWSVKIWVDDTREDCLIAICEQDADLSGGCWSRSRCSVFFTINTAGLLKVYDILVGLESPTTAFRICNESLTSIAPHQDGELLAIGSHNGNIYLVKCSEGHTIATKTDKANLVAYLERCSRFEKTVDACLKEIRLQKMQASVRENSAADHSPSRSKDRQKNRNNKERAQIKGEQHRKAKFRLKKEVNGNAFFEDLADTEAEFFQAVEREIASYPTLEDLDVEQMVSLQETLHKKKRKVLRDPLKIEQEIVASPEKAQQRKFTIREKTRAMRPKSRVESPPREIEVDKKEEVARAEAPSARPKKTPRRRRGILRKVCSVEICEPEICCADLEVLSTNNYARFNINFLSIPGFCISEKRKAKLRAQKLASREKESSRDVTPRKLSDLVQKLAEPSSVGKRSILLEEDGRMLANVLADEVKEAKREVRAWQETVASGKRDVRRARTTDVVQEKSHGKKRKAGSGDNESPVRDATEGGSDFRQLAETSTGVWKSVSEDETSRERGKGQAGKLDSHLGNCERKGGMDAALSTLYW
ncbi:Dynein intermediate chain 3, ciliary [Ooceraea biroi]|uniref:Dynein intermediate chain 3, ciliary n=1 Tax=Ooceraea biroi TaxID=2015173 RepID=A0A026X1Q2_OOCBI|nr:Dynein intermediate chain 3, ciliary [Ooceraea biroi]